MTTEMSSLIFQPSLILSYLKYRAIPARRLSTWRLLLSTLGSSSLDLDRRIGVVNVFLAATHEADLVTWAEPAGKELKGLAEQTLTEAFNGNSASSTLIVNILKTPGMTDCTPDIINETHFSVTRAFYRCFHCTRTRIDHSHHNKFIYITSYTRVTHVPSSSSIVSRPASCSVGRCLLKHPDRFPCDRHFTSVIRSSIRNATLLS